MFPFQAHGSHPVGTSARFPVPVRGAHGMQPVVFAGS